MLWNTGFWSLSSHKNISRQKLFPKRQLAALELEDRSVPAGFTSGSIQGQQGWSGGTIPIANAVDQVVDQSGLNSLSGVGAFRISNSTMNGNYNGNFSGWVFGPGLSESAGQPSSAVNADLFTATFWIKASSNVADGSNIEFDLGTTAGDDRNSFMAFTNRADADGGFQLRIGEPDGATGGFRATQIALTGIDRSIWHRVDISARFTDGDANDTFSVKFDGNDVINKDSGSPNFNTNRFATFEGYRNGLNSPYATTNRLYFRSGAVASSYGAFANDAAKGFLIDDVAYQTANQATPNTPLATYSTSFEPTPTTWQVQSDYFGTRDGVSQARSLRGLALTSDGESVYGGFIQGTSSWGIRKVDADVLAIPGTDTVIFGNTGNAAFGTNPQYTGGTTGTFQGWRPTGSGNQPKGVATDNRGFVYATTNNSTTAVLIYNSSLASNVASIVGNATPSGIAIHQVDSTYYAYISRNNGAIERWNVTDPSAPTFDNTWGVNGYANLRSVWADAYVQGLEVDRDGTVYAAGGSLPTAAQTGVNRHGDTVFKIPADGRVRNSVLEPIEVFATKTSVSGAMDVAIFLNKVYVTKYLGNSSAIAVLNKTDLSSAGADLTTGFARTNSDTDNGYSGIDVSYDGRLYVADQLYNIIPSTSNFTPPSTSFNPTPVTITNTRVNFDRILVSPQLEIPDLVYIDDAWASLSNGTEVDIDPVQTGIQPGYIGYNSFADIQRGVSAVQSGGNIFIQPGNYSGIDTTSKAVKLTPTGTLTINGALQLNADDTLQIDISSTGYDQLNVNGTVSLGNAAIDLNVAVNYLPVIGTTFNIINNDDSDAISGTFVGKPEASTVTFGSRTYTINYAGANNDFTIRVSSIALNPPISAIPAPQEINEDQTLVYSVATDNEIVITADPLFVGNMKVKLSVTSGVISLPTTTDLSFSIGDGSDATTLEFTGTLSAINAALDGLIYKPDLNYFGDDGIVIETNDLNATGNGEVVNQNTAIITVNPVNDAPSFVKGNNVQSDEDAGNQSIAQWATTITKGPANESTQTVSFEIVSNSNSTLFSQQPAIAPDGTLTYTAATNLSGTAIIEVRVKDTGGTDFNGVDVSSTETFTITVDPVNDAPTDIALSNNQIVENAPVGSSIGLLSTTDLLDNDVQFTYTLVDTATYPDNTAFTIDGSTLKSAGSFDFETKSSYTIQVRSTDLGGLFIDKVLTITVTPLNEQPSIDVVPTVVLPDVLSSSTSQSGTLVASLLVNATDAETPTTVGAAITGIHGTSGKWQYSLTGAINTWVTLPTIPADNAFLLSRTSYIRYLPNPGSLGFAGISFRAWDGQVGTNATLVSLTSNPIAFSNDVDTAWVQVGRTNPDLNSSGQIVFPSTTEDNLNPRSQLVKNLVGFLAVDFPARTNLGLAVTGFTGNGTWQVRIGRNWTPIGAVTDTNAYLLKSTDYIRFVPAANWHGTATITYRAWNIAQGPSGTRADATVGTQFGRESATSQLIVTPVNDAPEFDLSVLKSFSSTPRTVADLTATGASDVDRVLTPTPANPDVVDNTNLGIAITKIVQTGGVWEYKLAGSPNWVRITGVSTTRALLLNGSAEIRFNSGTSTIASGQIQYRLWDGSSGGVVGKFKGISGTGFSKLTETATFSLGNTAPNFDSGAARNFPSTKENEFPKDVFNQKVISVGGRRFLPPTIRQERVLSGQPISYLLGLFDDTDLRSKSGIAISAISETLNKTGGGTSEGTWEYMNDGRTWKAIGSLPAGTKLLLTSSDRLRFVPAENSSGIATITYHAWDQTTGVSGDRLTTSSDSISPTTLQSSWEVTPLTI